MISGGAQQLVVGDGWQRARPLDMGSCVQCGGKALQCSHLTSSGGMEDNTLAEVSRHTGGGLVNDHSIALPGSVVTVYLTSVLCIVQCELYFDTGRYISCFVSLYLAKSQRPYTNHV